MQSPIHIEHTDGSTADVIQLHYEPFPLHIVNTGHTVQVNPEPGSFITIEKTQYHLHQFHFHVPSEHQIRNQIFAMEGHLVHQSAAGKFAVIGILYNCGHPNPLVKLLWEHLPRNNGNEQTIADVIVDPRALIPADGQYFSYTGSLTTPPNSEGVQWILFQQPHTVSTSQLEQFTNLFGKNARSVKPLLGRRVLEGQL
jgi:carbonic anhydrase